MVATRRPAECQGFGHAQDPGLGGEVRMIEKLLIGSHREANSNVILLNLFRSHYAGMDATRGGRSDLWR